MIWLQILAAMTLIYLLFGLGVAIIRITIHDMPWQLFLLTILIWPSVCLDDWR